MYHHCFNKFKLIHSWIISYCAYLAKPVPTKVHDSGPTGAHIVLINAWKYFDMLPDGKPVLAGFLYRKIPKGLSYPPYNTEEDESVFLGNMHYQTGYVRNYVNQNVMGSMGMK